MKIPEKKRITTRFLRRREKNTKGKLEKKILGVPHGEIYLLHPVLLKDKGRLSEYPLLAHKNYWCIVELAFSLCVYTYPLLEHNSRTAERILFHLLFG